MDRSTHRRRLTAAALITVFAVCGAIGTSSARTAKSGAVDIQAREAAILGKPPRMEPLKPEELSADSNVAISDLVKEINLPAPDKVPEFIATMLRHPALYKAHMVLAQELFRGALAVRDRELAILRTGWLCQAPYEFGSHVKIGRRLGGITEDEVARLKIGSSAPGWNEHDHALLKAVEEMHSDAMISEATWAALSKSLNEKQLIELPILVGQYQGVAYVQNSLRVRLMPGAEGLTAK